MARKDVPDWMVCAAYKESATIRNNDINIWPYDILMKWTNEPEKVCYAAMQRSSEKGYVECGVSLRSGWITSEGEELLKNHNISVQ